VVAKVHFPDSRIGTASPFAVGIFLKVLALDFCGESIFRCSWLLWLRTRKVGRRDDSKTSSYDVTLDRNELAPSHLSPFGRAA
jgi:hypothetical protein